MSEKFRPLSQSELEYIVEKQQKEIGRLTTQGYVYLMQIQNLQAENTALIKENEEMKKDSEE
jgi:hypothetical protein